MWRLKSIRVSISGRGVTANMLDLGSSDSGFESRRPDIVESHKKFTRTIEDFTCAHCSKEVVGTGYTNHCPLCLWSKHVDVNPGDRAEMCGGMMEPVSGENESNKQMITQQCTTCGFRRRATLRPEDSFDAFITVLKKAALQKVVK